MCLYYIYICISYAIIVGAIWVRTRQTNKFWDNPCADECLYIVYGCSGWICASRLSLGLCFSRVLCRCCRGEWGRSFDRPTRPGSSTHHGTHRISLNFLLLNHQCGPHRAQETCHIKMYFEFTPVPNFLSQGRREFSLELHICAISQSRMLHRYLRFLHVNSFQKKPA